MWSGSMRVKLVTCRIKADIRKQLNEAVKRGELKRMKKDGNKPEVYYHPEFEHMAIGQRVNHEKEILIALSKVVARPMENNCFTIED
jgi:hypothetical protein